MRRFSLKSALGILAMTCSSIATANITLSQAIIVFQPGERPIHTIEVINIDDKRTFAVKTNVVEVTNPGGQDQVSEKSRSLVVAPNAFEVAAQNTRNVRLMLRKRNKSDIEKVYRVTFTPEAPSRTVVEEKPDGIKTKIDIIVGMGALILVPPQEIKYKLEASREGAKLSFVNNSNISTEIQPRTICKTEDKCFRFNGTRIYPGRSWEYQLPDGFEKVGLALSVRAAGKYSAVEFAPID
ncbi:MAG: molecular chaperone [Gammaproteobacteria bacterium]|nr:MAG: molecular chaperone [Gammaproteobacteria bacterium]